LTGALVLAGIHLFGLAGAIAGDVASEALSRVVLLARGRRFLALSGRAILDGPALARIAAAAALACAPAWAVRRLLGEGAPTVIAAAVTYAASYLALRRARGLVAATAG
jgi:hypothetical protein